MEKIKQVLKLIERTIQELPENDITRHNCLNRLMKKVEAIDYAHSSTQLNTTNHQNFEEWKKENILKESNNRFLYIHGGWWSYAEICHKYNSRNIKV